ncbi:hypothetical protein D3C84_1048810 [compost metagenome]
MDQPALLIHRHDFADAHVERIHTSLPDTVLECRQARGTHPRVLVEEEPQLFDAGQQVL